MSDYVNPDYPTPGTSMFLKPQVQESIDPGFYYMGGGFNPFNQPMVNMNMGFNQPSMGDSRRFLPEMPQQNPQMNMNAFVDFNRRQMNAPQQPMMPQPPQVSPWAQMNNPPVYPMNNNAMFMQPVVDPMSMRPYGNYSDMAHGQIVPPINKKMMWDESNMPNSVYDTPHINWNALQPQPQNNQMYTPIQQQQMNVGGFVNMQSPYGEHSVFSDANKPVTWNDRANSIWK